MRDHVVSHVIPAALSLLPSRMESVEARAMLVAIGLQESRFQHRRQIRGPANGFWQFEPVGVQGVLHHHASAQYATEICDLLLYEPSDAYNAIRDNDTLACCFARLLLWTHPRPLPTTPEDGWSQYVSLWRPGRPHRNTWDQFWNEAHDVIRQHQIP